MVVGKGREGGGWWLRKKGRNVRSRVAAGYSPITIEGEMLEIGQIREACEGRDDIVVTRQHFQQREARRERQLAQHVE